MSEYASVIDASALLAFIFSEPTSEAIDLLDGAAISAVNLSEALAKIAERGGDVDEALNEIQSLDLAIVPFDARQAKLTAILRPATKRLGLGLGDRACLALGNDLGVPVLTADTAWTGLRGSSQVSVPIKLVR